MNCLIGDQYVIDELLESRRASGGDRYDEVWEGVYWMSPTVDNEHQNLASELTAIFRTVIDWNTLGRTLSGANITDRDEDWTDNYRVPGVLVFMNGTSAIDRQTHWFGGPDFAIEIVSPKDRTLEKLDFYGSTGTRELLVIDRNPWQLTLYRANVEKKMLPVAISSIDQPASIRSQVLPIVFQLSADPAAIRLSHPDQQTLRDIPIQLSKTS